MRLRPLGRTGLQVSEIGFGGFAVGGVDYGPTDDAESIAALERACDLGVTFFDTADLYGDGHSEILVGRVLAERNPDAVVATKVGFASPIHGRGQSVKDFSRRHIVAAAERSLKRLRREAIDLYQLHNPTLADLESGEAFEAMEELVRAGKVRFWGVSVGTKDAAALCRLVMACPTASSLQLVHNLFHAVDLETLQDDIRRRGIAVIARAPLEYGLLAGKFRSDQRFAAGDHRGWRWSADELAQGLGRVEALRSAFQGRGFTLPQLAIGFALAASSVSVVICGAKRPDQVDENVRAAELLGASILDTDLERARRLVVVG